MAALPQNDRVTAAIPAIAGQTDLQADFPLIRSDAVRVQRVRDGVTSILAAPAFTIPATSANGFTVRLASPALAGDVYHVFSQLPPARERAHALGGAVRTETLEADAVEAQAQLQELRRDFGRVFMVPFGVDPAEGGGGGGGGVGGTIDASNVVGLNDAIYTRIRATLQAGANITLTPNDDDQQIAVAAAGGGGGGGGGVTSVAGRTGDVTLAKADVGLSNVDNTSDANKPVSTAQQTALNLKFDKTGGDLSGEVRGTQFFGGPKTSWFGDNFTNVQTFAPFQGVSTNALMGVVGASRTSDSLQTGAQGTMGLAGFVLNNDNAFPKNAYGCYLESRHTTTAAGAVTHVAEFNPLNMASVTADQRPDNAIFTDNLCEGLRLSSGRPDVSSSIPVSSAIVVTNNGSTFRRGIVFASGALTSGGPLEAIAMDASHSVAWHANGARIAFDRSDTARRRTISNSLGPFIDLVRSRATGNVQPADILGAVRFLRNDSGSELAGGQLFVSREENAGFRTTLSARKDNGAEIFVTLGLLGLDSLDPWGPNVMTLGATHAWAGIRSQTSVVVTSDAREKSGFSRLPPALAAELRALPIGKFQYLSAIAAKGEEGARWHVGVLAQDVEAAFTRAGEDPERYAVFCSDPWLEEVDEDYEEDEAITELVDETRHEDVVMPDGSVQRRVWTEQVARPVVNVLPVFDEAGQPVWAYPPRPPMARVVQLDAEGQPVWKVAPRPALALTRDDGVMPLAEVGDREVLQTSPAVEGEPETVVVPVDHVAGREVLELIPAYEGEAATVTVPATRRVTRTRKVLRQIEDDGVPRRKLGIRYEQLLLLMLAAWTEVAP